MNYPVNEIFYSLQGEGYHTGLPALFIRLSGCNLRCGFCDTEHASHRSMSVPQIIDELKRLATAGTAIITGGEPALYDLEPLVEALHGNGYSVHIETNGTLPIDATVDWITCSPKRQGDLQEYHVDPSMFNRANEVKIVFENDEAPEELADRFLTDNLFLQPCSCLNVKETVAYILEHPRWRLSLQTHKILDIP